MFQLGDVVRLNRGWSPMIVIRIHNNGEITAKYATHDCYPVTPEDYLKNRWSSSSSTYTRFQSGFTAWDGAPISKVHYRMTNRYKSKSMPDVSGRFLNTTYNGAIVLEHDDGSIHVLAASDAMLDIPFTFQVKAAHNNYRCDYTLPQGSSNVVIGDVLVSKRGNLYTVIAVDTKNVNPKAEFNGHRVVKEEI